MVKVFSEWLVVGSDDWQRVISATDLLVMELGAWDSAHEPRDGTLYLSRRSLLNPEVVAATPGQLRKKYFERAEVDAALRRAREKGGEC